LSSKDRFPIQSATCVRDYFLGVSALAAGAAWLFVSAFLASLWSFLAGAATAGVAAGAVAVGAAAGAVAVGAAAGVAGVLAGSAAKEDKAKVLAMTAMMFFILISFRLSRTNLCLHIYNAGAQKKVDKLCNFFL
jgi:hypothetical protein